MIHPVYIIYIQTLWYNPFLTVYMYIYIYIKSWYGICWYDTPPHRLYTHINSFAGPNWKDILWKGRASASVSWESGIWLHNCIIFLQTLAQMLCLKNFLKNQPYFEQYGYFSGKITKIIVIMLLSFPTTKRYFSKLMTYCTTVLSPADCSSDALSVKFPKKSTLL